MPRLGLNAASSEIEISCAAALISFSFVSPPGADTFGHNGRSDTFLRTISFCVSFFFLLGNFVLKFEYLLPFFASQPRRETNSVLAPVLPALPVEPRAVSAKESLAI